MWDIGTVNGDSEWSGLGARSRVMVRYLVWFMVRIGLKFEIRSISDVREMARLKLDVTVMCGLR